LFFEWVFPIILEETNHQDPAARDRPITSALQDVKMEELLALTVWMAHDQRYSIMDYYLMVEHSLLSSNNGA
jgi:hypothetical protein